MIRLYVRHEEDERDLYQEILFQAAVVPVVQGESKFSTGCTRVGLNTVLTFKRRPPLVVPHDDLAALQPTALARIQMRRKRCIWSFAN